MAEGSGVGRSPLLQHLEHRLLLHLSSGSEADSNLRFIDFVYHSTLRLRVIKKKEDTCEGLGFGVESTRFRARDSPSEIALPFRAWGLGSRDQNSGGLGWGLRVWGVNIRDWGFRP